MSLLRYLKKGSGSVLPSPGGLLSRHMPSSSIALTNKEVKIVPDAPNSVGLESTLCILSVDRKREVSKLNVGVVLIMPSAKLVTTKLNLMSIAKYTPLENYPLYGSMLYLFLVLTLTKTLTVHLPKISD